MRLAFAWLAFLMTAAPHAPALPPCDQRPTHIDPPWVNAEYWCLELVIADDSGGELGFTALAAASDGTLYAARPTAGAVYELRDADADGLPESPTLVAEGLTLPNGLTYADDALYITGGPHLYRLRGGQLETLVDDLPAGTGFWTGGVAVGGDGRLYVAVGAPCDFCQPDDPARGAILSFAPDGGDRQIIARGLRHPADIAFLNGVLWTVDTARDGLFDEPDLDELNRVTPGTHFGWPYCVGAANRPDWQPGAFDCVQAAPPALTLPTHSAPTGLAAYTASTFPHITGSLLVALHGSNNQAELRGYALAVVTFDERGEPEPAQIIIPEATPGGASRIPLQQMHYQGSGFWPRRPFDVAVSREGWIYVSVGGGQIYALRP